MIDYKSIFLLLLSLLLACLLPFRSQGQATLDSLSLEQVMQLAQEQVVGKSQAQLNVQEAKTNLAIFRTRLRPQIAGYANFPNYAKTFREITQPDGTVQFQPITNNNSAVGLNLVQEVAATGGTIFLQSDLQRFDNFENNSKLYNGIPFRLGIIQPLFGFNALKWSKKLTPIQLQESQKQYHSDIEQLRTDAATLFFNLLSVYQELQIAISNQKSNQSLFDIAQERYQLGKISRRDLMQLELELITAQKDQFRAQQSVQTASAAIYTFLGKKYAGEVIIPQLPTAQSTLTIDPDIAVQQAKLNRPEMDTYARQLTEAERDLARTKSEGGLQMDLQASFGLVRSAQVVSDIYSRPQQEQLVQLQVNIPIIDWGRQKHRVDLSKAQRAFTQQQVAQDRLAFDNSIQQAVVRFEQIQQELILVKEIQRVAQERFQISKESYVLGSISITELTLSQREKDQAVREYIRILQQYWLRYQELRAMTLYDFNTATRIIY